MCNYSRSRSRSAPGTPAVKEGVGREKDLLNDIKMTEANEGRVASENPGRNASRRAWPVPNAAA